MPTITAAGRKERIHRLLEGELVVEIAPEQGTERLHQAIEVTVSVVVATQAGDKAHIRCS